MRLLFFILGGGGLFFILINMFTSSFVTVNQSKSVSETVKIAQKTILNDVALITQLQLLIHDIRVLSMGNYGNLKKENFKYDFGSFDWNIGAINDNQFFIELKNVDKTSCDKLVNAIPEAVTVKINSFVKKDCDDLNSIQFIFE